MLKDVTYSFLYELDTPGNPKTRIKDLLQQKYASEYQCPQGLCLTKDYIIVSSYALEEDKLGALTLYDRNTLEHTHQEDFAASVSTDVRTERFCRESFSGQTVGPGQYVVHFQNLGL